MSNSVRGHWQRCIASSLARQMHGHYEIALPVGAEHEPLLANGAEPVLLVKGNRPRVLLPHAEPHQLRSPLPRRAERRVHQQGTEAAAVPLAAGVQAGDLDGAGRRTVRQGNRRWPRAEAQVDVSGKLAGIVDREEHAVARILELSAL